MELALTVLLWCLAVMVVLVGLMLMAYLNVRIKQSEADIQWKMRS